MPDRQYLITKDSEILKVLILKIKAGEEMFDATSR